MTQKIILRKIWFWLVVLMALYALFGCKTKTVTKSNEKTESKTESKPKFRKSEMTAQALKRWKKKRKARKIHKRYFQKPLRLQVRLQLTHHLHFPIKMQVLKKWLKLPEMQPLKSQLFQIKKQSKAKNPKVKFRKISRSQL